MLGEMLGKRSAQEIRLQMRRSFDALNEAQAKTRQFSRDRSAIRDAEENKRWVKREVAVVGTGEMDTAPLRS